MNPVSGRSQGWRCIRDETELLRWTTGDMASETIYCAAIMSMTGEPCFIICALDEAAYRVATWFDELLRIVHPGGLIALTLVHDETPPGFIEAIDAHTTKGAWERVALGEPVSTLPGEDPSLLH
ncbi:MAG: hypothetical protein GDA49_06485 [Rhodospirillales bacterium]|nr:hypothetical protein [Rhodospirillales bacterium]